MSLDIGDAFGEGVDRTFARNGLLLAAALALLALVTSVLYQTMTIGLLETMLETFQGMSPQELNVTQGEYDRLITDLQTQLETTRGNAPLALPLSAGVAAAGLLALAVISEAVTMAAVRTFAAETDETFPEGIGDGLGLATLNGFIGGIVVWGLILVGLALFVVPAALTGTVAATGGLILVGLPLFVVPGLFFAVAFYFLRQEIALNNKNFVQAMADSWRFTKGHRIEVFALGAVLVILTQGALLVGGAVSFLSPIAGEIAAAALSGVFGAFGAAVVTRAYVQLSKPALGEEDDEDDEDPYAAALGPDDIPE